MLRDRLAEGLALLRVLDRVFERGPRDAQAAGGDVEPLGFEPGHHLLESLALAAADQVRARAPRKSWKVQLAGLDGLVAHLVDVAADRQAGRAFFDDERADAAVRRLGRRVRLGQQQEHVRAAAVGHPHLRAVDDVRVAVAPRRRRDRLQVGARVRFGQADAAARFALREPRQETLLLIRPCRTAPARRRARGACRGCRRGPSIRATTPRRRWRRWCSRRRCRRTPRGRSGRTGPSVFIVSTSASGYSSRCSMPEATGMTSRSTNSRTVRATSCCSSSNSNTASPGREEVVQALRPAHTADLKVRTTTDNDSCCAIVRIANEPAAAGRNHRDRPRAGRRRTVRHAAARGPGRTGDQDRAPRRRRFRARVRHDRARHGEPFRVAEPVEGIADARSEAARGEGRAGPADGARRRVRAEPRARRGGSARRLAPRRSGRSIRGSSSAV